MYVYRVSQNSYKEVSERIYKKNKTDNFIFGKFHFKNRIIY